ncbi:MAG: hypothetical protein WCX65_19520, partial [bacterium]
MDANGVPKADGSYTASYKICTVSDCTSGVVTTITSAGVTLANGLFSDILSGGVPTDLSAIDFNAANYYLQVTVDGTTYAPPQMIAPAAIALNADRLDGLDSSAFMTAATDNWVNTTGDTMTGQLVSTLVTGTSPFSVTSTTVNTNLNADLLDGLHESSFFRLSQSETVTGIPAFNGGTTGTTAPFTVDSTFLVTNLNADLLDGYHAASFILDGCTDCLNETEIEDIYVLNTSDTMSGSLSVGTTLGVTGAITGSSTVQGTQLISTIAVGTSPLAVTSTTVVANLNSDQLDGYHAASFILDGCTDCLNATEIEDIYVLNTSDTMSGSLSVGTTLG